MTATWPTYAGHLSAGHLGEWVDIDGFVGRLVEVRHSERFLTVRLVLVDVLNSGRTETRDVAPRHVVCSVSFQPSAQGLAELDAMRPKEEK